MPPKMERKTDKKVLTPYGDWAEERMRSFLDRYDSTPDSLADTLLQPGSNTLELLRRSQQKATFRLPMEIEFKDHERCKTAASKGHLTAENMRSSRPPGMTACWMPKILPREQRQQQGQTSSMKLELVTPGPVHAKIQNVEGLRKALQHRGAPSAGWQKLKESMVQDVLLVAWLRSSKKLRRRTFPEELFRKIAAFLDPIEDVLLCADYLRSVAAEARAKDVREELLEKSMTAVASASIKHGLPRVGGSVFVVSVASKSNFGFPFYRCHITLHLPTSPGGDLHFTGNNNAWGSGVLDTLFESQTWERIREFERQQMRGGPAAQRGVIGERVEGTKAQVMFMACEVLRRYYVGAHGLKFQYKDCTPKGSGHTTDFTVSWDDASKEESSTSS